MTKEKREGRHIGTRDAHKGMPGLPLRCNLFVIQYIYSHIKKDGIFMYEKQGQKAEACPIFGTDGFPVSKPRFYRACKGDNFQFPKSQTDRAAGTFGIADMYLRKTEPVPFKIKGISDVDWKCFFRRRYKDAVYELPQNVEGNSTAIKAKADKVEGALKSLVAGWEKLGHDDPVYAICYYYHHGERFDMPDIIRSLKDDLSKIDYRKWDEEDMDSLKEIYQLMKGHYRYISSLVSIDVLNEEQKGKQ